VNELTHGQRLQSRAFLHPTLDFARFGIATTLLCAIALVVAVFPTNSNADISQWSGENYNCFDDPNWYDSAPDACEGWWETIVANNIDNICVTWKYDHWDSNAYINRHGLWQCNVRAYDTDGRLLNSYAVHMDSRRLQGDFYRLNLPYSISDQPGPSCPRVGNPIVVATGDKYQREVDWRDPRGRLDFVRHYNSQPITGDSVHWHHRFGGWLEPISQADQAPGASSGWYASREAACLQGSQDIASAVTAMLGDGWEADFNNGRCNLAGASTGGGGGTSNHVAAAFIDSDDASPDVIRLHRADGGIQSFQQVQGQWRPLDGDSATLTEQPDGSWRYEDRGGRRQDYDADGRLAGVVNAARDTFTLSYNGLGQLATVTDADDRTLSLDYSDGQLRQLTGPGGVIATYSYSSGHLQRVDYADGRSRIYHYEDTRFPDALTGITDENGVAFASWQYDDQGRATVSEHAGGAEHTELVYNADGTTTVTNALGRQTTYHFATLNGERKVTEVEGHPTTYCVGANRSYTYTPEGWLASKTDWQGHTTTYEYNARGLVTRRVEAAGTPQERVITKTWDPDYRLPVRITEPDRIIDYTYDADGRLLSKRISARN